jgi:hypothetical protein
VGPLQNKGSLKHCGWALFHAGGQSRKLDTTFSWKLHEVRRNDPRENCFIAPTGWSNSGWDYYPWATWWPWRDVGIVRAPNDISRCLP